MKRPDVNNPDSSASRFRKKRFGRVEALLGRIVELKGRASVLDVGGRREYWDLASDELKSKLSLTLINYGDELHPRPEGEETLDVTYVQGDGCHMPQYGTGQFDLVHSNSVIEHVGELQRMAAFADECRRVGDAIYLQTPYLWFPIEPHYGVPFVHWLPPSTRAQLMLRFKLGYADQSENYREAIAAADHTLIIDQRLLKELFPDATMYRERFALMTKSVIMIREPKGVSEG